MRAPERLGPYLLRQSGHSFPLGRDTLLLSGFATVRRGWRVCDLGCGTGALLLLLLGREPQLAVTGVELDGADAAMARRNLAENGLPGEIHAADLRQARAFLPAGGFDLVVSNPPYFAKNSGGSGGPARMEEACTFAQVCEAAAYLLKNGGRFALVHRPGRLCALLADLARCGLEPKRMQLVQHSRAKPPSAVLLEAVRQGKPGLELLPVYF